MLVKRLLCASSFFVSSLCLSCPSWQSKIENNQTLGWDYVLNPQNIHVKPDPLTSENSVLKVTINADASWPNGHTRAEVKHNGCNTEEDQQTFFSWEFYLDSPVKTFNHIAYWETDKTYQQSMGFSLQPELEGDAGVSALSFFSSQPERRVQWQGIVPVKTWHKLSLAIKWSEDESKGEINLWFNNKQVIENLAVKTKPDANQLFIQLGLHRNQSEVAQDSIYLRKFAEFSHLQDMIKDEV